jgi:signal transduction histidine kinase
MNSSPEDHPRPTLGRKLILTNVALLSGVLLVASVSGWGLLGLRETAFETVEEYDEVRQLEDAVRHVDVAMALATRASVVSPEIAVRTDAARALLEGFLEGQRSESHFDMDHQAGERGLAFAALERLSTVKTSVAERSDNLPADDATIAAGLRDAEQYLSQLIEATDVASLASSAKQRSRLTIGFVAVSSTVLIMGCVAVSVLGYRGVMVPLRRLRDGARRVAHGKFDQRLSVTGDAEISAVAREFNEMAIELDGIYRTLERRIVDTSRELARSERLASVGFLAAGVAHEISTPLNIISGYAELTRRALANLDVNGSEIDDAREALQTIVQEAFRCREITEQLLSLSRMGEGSRSVVALKPIVDEVASMVRGPVGPMCGRRLTVANTLSDTDRVRANAAELKQVLLNLLSNAVEATAIRGGAIELNARRSGDLAMIEVHDDGIGIDSAKIELVFEPFYSARSAGRQGVGLGLSISSAIVQAHGGTLSVASGGVGQGATFTVKIPVLAGGARRGP